MNRMSDAESIIMDVVWSNPSPVTPNDVMNGLPMDRKWQYKTVATFLLRLSEKGLLSCEKNGKFNAYIPRITKEEYIGFEINTLLSRYQNSARHLVAALFRNDIDKEKLDELISLVEKEGQGC